MPLRSADPSEFDLTPPQREFARRVAELVDGLLPEYDRVSLSVVTEPRADVLGLEVRAPSDVVSIAMISDGEAIVFSDRLHHGFERWYNVERSLDDAQDFAKAILKGQLETEVAYRGDLPIRVEDFVLGESGTRVSRGLWGERLWPRLNPFAPRRTEVRRSEPVPR